MTHGEGSGHQLLDRSVGAELRISLAAHTLARQDRRVRPDVGKDTVEGLPHIHPEAWLSGVYYPQVPETIRDGDGPAGWLEFGDADRAFPSRLPPRIVRVRPEEGTLVLFPSYRTIPFDADGTRISVAFDLVPLRV
jgi:hypothetical protein